MRIREEPPSYIIVVGLDVLTAAAMKGTVWREPNIWEELDRLRIQGRKTSETRNQYEEISKQTTARYYSPEGRTFRNYR
jgi:hypothetical protein